MVFYDNFPSFNAWFRRRPGGRSMRFGTVLAAPMLPRVYRLLQCNIAVTRLKCGHKKNAAKRVAMTAGTSAAAGRSAPRNGFDAARCAWCAHSKQGFDRAAGGAGAHAAGAFRVYAGEADVARGRPAGRLEFPRRR